VLIVMGNPREGEGEEADDDEGEIGALVVRLALS
jgi:hypothetical protein